MSALQARLDVHGKVGAALAAMTDDALAQLLRGAEHTVGWGLNRSLVVDGVPVFAKSVPLTNREHARPGCTENLFELPAFYHYGVGSAGFGAFRELSAHRKTTDWALSGAAPHFPLMYHHRVLPRTGPDRAMGAERIARYVRYWNGSEAVGEYICARQAARHEVVIFLEHATWDLNAFIAAHLDRLEVLERVLPPMRAAVRFLRARDVVHFDVHGANILLEAVDDGGPVLLSDYGLVLDADHELDDAERAMLDSHRHFDEGELLTCLARPLFDFAARWDEPRQQAVEARYGGRDPFTLLSHLEELLGEGALQLPDAYRALLLRHREPILRMGDFFQAMRGPRKDAVYRDAELAASLAAVG